MLPTRDPPQKKRPTQTESEGLEKDIPGKLTGEKMNKYLSIIAFNVNGLNAPIKRHRVAEWIRKHDPHICCLHETHLQTKDLHRLKVKGWKKIFQANGQEKKLG